MNIIKDKSLGIDELIEGMQKIADARNRHILYENKWGINRGSLTEFKLQGAGDYKFIEYLKEKHFEWWLSHYFGKNKRVAKECTQKQAELIIQQLKG